MGKVQVVHPHAAALAPPDPSLAKPYLSQPACTWNEIASLRVSEDALLQRDQVIVAQLAGPLESPAILAEASRFYELASHRNILPRRHTTR